MAHVTVAERRPQLIRAAIDLMTREGVPTASTRAIAAELGVAQATVHYVFGSKEELYRAVIEHLTQDLVGYVRDLTPPSADFGATVAFLATRLWQTVRERPGIHQLLTELYVFALRSPQLRDAIEDHRRTVNEETTALIGEAARRANTELMRPPEEVARHFLAGFEGLTLQHMGLPDDDAEQASLRALVSSAVAYATGELVLLEIPQDAR